MMTAATGPARRMEPSTSQSASSTGAGKAPIGETSLIQAPRRLEVPPAALAREKG